MKSKYNVLTGILALSVMSLGAVNPAFAADQQINVNDSNLNDSSVSSSFTATVVSVPQGTETVKFILDGVYLGQDTTAPYTWNVSSLGAGSHRLKARSEGATDMYSTADFKVSTISPTPTPAPTSPAPTPAPTPTPTTGKTVNVSTSAQLVNALKNATSGTVINLADGTYTGKFVASASGTSGTPVTLTGSSKAVLTTGSITGGYGLHITGDYWNVKGITVTKASKGVVLDGSLGTVLNGIDVGNTGDEAVHFRKGSSNGKIINSKIHDTGLKQPAYGEGIYVGTAKSNWASIMGSSTTPDNTNNVIIENNRIYNTSAEGIDIKEGTSGGKILGNVFTNSGYSGSNYADSWVDVKGNGYTISNNSGSGTKLDAFQVHKALNGWGNNNKFSNNNVISGVPGYLVSVQSGVTGTSIACQTTNAGQGISNIACS